MMDSNNAIEVKNLKKKYKVYLDKGNQLKERILFSKRNRYEERWVLNGISFDIKKGEAIGLIGHNGCGKSTTLKLLTRIIYPDEGTIEMQGRVSSLIELGAGFHPDMSGRENIYTNAAIFGLNKKEIDERIDDIIEFSELEEYIDNPVRTYSSGMYMRLAFSVAINVKADILLIDEILAVGDAGFQAKCFNKLQEIKAEGTTIVIVSHSSTQIEQICDRSIWIDKGLIAAEGKPRDINPLYLGRMAEERAEKAKKKDGAAIERKQDEANGGLETSLKDNSNRYGNKKAVISKIEVLNSKEEQTYSFKTGEKMSIRVSYKVNEFIANTTFGIGIFRKDGAQCYGTNTLIDRYDGISIDKDGEIEIVINPLNLIQGSYTVDLAIEEDQGLPVDYWKKAFKFDVYSEIGDVGIARLEHEWKIK